ncbi:hypothetical protein PFICI_05395 [Pestalotiopsis fici W106-1]|uniref:Uncharacterized protein n=1 Tax=Pestalotiopsis fici (strain W106-1 / CGMCC3.15140) TaxID=1229662 RepID=W3XBW7_PESFW|nr:uncharacterized protein PFICI_05395 [Pestalotiopsis fici W106-1]ETS83519.1 hypothetical protein PFICI_05395 [Pestalotiopsis fici W106-1]
MARFFAIVFMLFAMLHAALAIPHENVLRGLYFPRANITGETANVTSTNATTAATNETASSAAIKRAMRSHPIALRVPGRD